MHLRLSLLAAALMASTTPAWAATASLPTYETYSSVMDSGINFFFSDPAYPAFVPQTSVTNMSGATASITGNDYTSTASTTLGGNHAYVQGGAIPTSVLGVSGFSGWYDQVTITGGTGTGTAQFTVQLNGTVDAGAIAGGMSYTLGTSSVHPSQLTSTLNAFNLLAPPWPMDAVNPIATYLLGVSPYNDTSILFSGAPTPPTGGTIGIPSINDPGLPLGGGADMGFPIPDLILTPGAGQVINVTLHGTLNFTYGEAFYLIGGLGTTVIGDGLQPFCSFLAIGGTCIPPVKDGAGATTLDFSNSANLVNIALPEGATASFASGTAYNVTAVPEPGEWLMLLAGLGLIGWRRHRKPA